MICAKCGASNPPESAYCGGCGSFLAPAPEGSAQANAVEQAAPAASPAGPDVSPVVASASEETPTLRYTQPAEQIVPQTPQPTPPASEFANRGSSPMAPQETPGAGAPPLAAPGTPSGAYPAQTPVPPSPSGAYSAQTPPPGFSSGAYPAQNSFPGSPSGTYPLQEQPGAVPPSTIGEFPAGVYPSPLPGAAIPGQQMSGTYPGQPSQPGWGEYPGQQVSGVYPGQPSQPGWGMYPGPALTAQPAGPSKLINPLPLWAFIVSIVVVAALLAVLLFFTGSDANVGSQISDWAAGAKTAGIVALVIGVLLLISFGVRAALGMLAQTNTHRRSQVISSLLLILLLIAFGAIGLTQGSAIHAMQAHALEGQQQWQLAVNEYQASGQGTPSSEDIARTYNEWGTQLLNQGKYSEAIDKYNYVVANYNMAATGLANAEKSAISAYQSWATQAAQKQDYASAVQHYDALLNQSYCNSGSCQSQISALDASAYYKLAEQQLNKQNYASSVAAFNQLTTRFADSSDAKQSHADYARALWGEGQQQLTSACSSAVTTYQQLSTQFSDTPEGQQAKTALSQPESVKGQFTSTIPSGNNVPVVGLVQGVTSNMSSDQFYALLDKSPVAQVNSDGSFSFKSVKQGNYDLVWGTINKGDSREEFFVGQRYPAAVGPLCAFDFGHIDETFPTP